MVCSKCSGALIIYLLCFFRGQKFQVDFRPIANLEVDGKSPTPTCLFLTNGDGSENPREMQKLAFPYRSCDV